MKLIEGQIIAHTLGALFHMTSALCGHATRRKISRGFITASLGELSDEEKVDEAMSSANAHIHHVWECIEHLSVK